MRAEAREGPGQVGLHGDDDRAAGGDNAQEHAGAVRALAAAGEEDVEAQLGDVLKLALGRLGPVRTLLGGAARAGREPRTRARRGSAPRGPRHDRAAQRPGVAGWAT